MYFIPAGKLSAFDKKPETTRLLINQALHILDRLGVPVEDLTPRKKERMDMAFLAVLDVDSPDGWSKAKDQNDSRSMKTRDIIAYINKAFHENISSGSYDDIRRQDLKLPVLAGIIVNTLPESARNDPKRGYALSAEYSGIIRRYGDTAWERDATDFMAAKTTLKGKMRQRREVNRIEVITPSGQTLRFGAGAHNLLQKAIVEQFLPVFGYGAELLYVGDAAKKHLFHKEESLHRLGFFGLGHGELPDIIAYSRQKNWLFVIEAVHSCNPVTIARKMRIDELATKCTADIVYVSAFLNRLTFAKFIKDIAWETEVWIASDPEHMIHFNGDKFLGPHT